VSMPPFGSTAVACKTMPHSTSLRANSSSRSSSVTLATKSEPVLPPSACRRPSIAMSLRLANCSLFFRSMRTNILLARRSSPLRTEHFVHPRLPQGV
ncbi:hypothetical protein BGZ98_004287, partial [Dissophora globulifera]